MRIISLRSGYKINLYANYTGGKYTVFLNINIHTRIFCEYTASRFVSQYINSLDNPLYFRIETI